MKKQNILLTALIIFLSVAMSFETKAQKMVWSIGPEAGVSFSNYGLDAETNEAKPGGVAGMFVTYSIVNTFAITTKFLFYDKGATFTATNTKQTLRYFEIPVIGRFFLNREGDFRPNIFLGPSFGFMTGAYQKVGNNDRAHIDSYKGIYNGVDIGVTGGVGFNFRIYNETYLVLDARFTHGLSDITIANDKVNNNTVALTAGVSFGF